MVNVIFSNFSFEKAVNREEGGKIRKMTITVKNVIFSISMKRRWNEVLTCDCCDGSLQN